MPEQCTVLLAATAGPWREAIPDLGATVEAAVRRAVAAAGASGRCEVSVVLTDDEEIRRLNLAYRGIGTATNVLAFPVEPAAEAASQDRPHLLGDIVVAYGTMAGEAAAQHKTLGDHLAHMLVHGALHLCGFDHETDAGAEAMESLERDILGTLRVADPYAAGRAPGP